MARVQAGDKAIEIESPSTERITSLEGELAGLPSEHVSAIFTDLRFVDAPRARGTFSSFYIRDLSLVRSETERAFGVERCFDNRSADCRAQFCIGLNLDSPFRAAQGGRSTLVGTREFVLIDMTLPFRFDMYQKSSAIWLHIPRQLLVALVPSIHPLLAMSIPSTSGVGKILATVVETSLDSVATLSWRGRASLASSIVDLAGGLLLEETPQSSKGLSRSRRRTLERAHEAIEVRLSNEKLDPAMIADAIGISQRYLHELFAQDGHSVMGWTTWRRLISCRRMLEESAYDDVSISEIAMNCGFSNISSFNRAFKRTFGRSPRSFRIFPAHTSRNN